MKKISCVIVLSLITVLQLYAQNSITGRVIDYTSRKGLDFVNVAVKKAGTDQLLTGASTESDGSFNIVGLENGKYDVTFSFMGYIEQSKEVVLNGSAVNLGKISMREDTRQLQEVEVVG